MRDRALFVGVDVAKAELVIAVHEQGGAARHLPNAAEPIQEWLQGVPTGSAVAMESTGKYWRVLAEAAHAAGMRVYVLNARDVHYYAKALGARGKTDRLDAEVIARYVAEHHVQVKPWHPAPGVEMRLQELLKRRWVLTSQRVLLRQSLNDMPTLKDLSAHLQHAFAGALEEIDRQLIELTRSDEVLNAGVARLREITGFGMQASILLGSLFKRIGFSNADAAVAYSGLDPRPNDSGTRRGKRRLSKRGPGILRRQLYLAAWAASRSRALKPLYEAIRARGFATTQALIILARKLLRVAWAIWRTQRPFDPTLLTASAACAKP